MNTRTGLDKAALKFALQDRKISQNVSVKSALFLIDFFGNFSLSERIPMFTASPGSRLTRASRAKLAHGEMYACRPFFRMPPGKIIPDNFLSIIFLFFLCAAIKHKLFERFLPRSSNNFLELLFNALLLAIYAVIQLDALTQPRGVHHHDSNGHGFRRRHPARRRRIPEGQAEGSSRHPGGRLRHPSVADVA
ncbi:hypothetical protein [Paraburkholderia phenazinium]|uniref:hypothetical protein n=1 Tax=Paraburkholderia phenazinium TaxID=60549 RepID=UPI001FC8591E|nr:hypothetical protein [Paraburkholderia phenazinium]